MVSKWNKEELKKIPHLNRYFAKLIDLFIVIALAAILPKLLGPLAAIAYSLLADGMNFGPFQGQSVGKKVFDFQAVNTDLNLPANFRDSAIRNSTLGFGIFFAMIPVWGWLILLFIGIPLFIMEIYLIQKMEKGHRLGDVMADTEVRSMKSL